MSRCALWVALGAAALQGQERFPKPEPEKVFAELKVYTASGSPLRTPRENWTGARKLIENDPEWKRWLQTRRSEVDEWIAKRHDRVEWVAGWWHNFVNESDGGFLTWTPDPPQGVSEKVFGGWVFGFRSRNGEHMLEAARLWRLTGEKKYFDWAAGQLDFYAANYEKWPVQTALSKSRLMAQSLDDANMLVRFTRAARTLGEDATPARRRVWHENLFRPMAALLDETFQRVHNIACWQRSAMAMAALYGGDEKLWKRAIDGPFGVRRQVRDGVTSDYLWLEQSLGYNSYVVSAFLPLFEYAGLESRLDELRNEAAAIENLMLAPSLLRFPDAKLPTPADSTGSFRRWPERGALAQARRVFPTWPGLEAAAGQRSWDNLLDPPEDPRPWNPSAVESRNLESSRMAVLKKGRWQVYFHYGQLDSSHAQAEALNYEAYFENTDITHDPGTVGYGSPLHRGFYQTGAAHNVPLIDGQGQAKWAPGELIEFDAAGLVAARQPQYRPEASVERRLRIDGRQLWDIVKITTTGGAEHRLGLVLHVQGQVDLPPGFKPDPDFSLPYWTGVKTALLTEMNHFRVRFGERLVNVRVSARTPLKVAWGVTPDAPPARRESLYFETVGREEEFTVVWEPEIVEAIPGEDNAAARQKRVELNLLGFADTQAGESRRNENVQFNLVDNNALKELNLRIGTTATIITEFRADRGYFGAEFGNVPASPPHMAPVNDRGFHGTARWSHLNSVTSARTFFQAGDVKPAHENDYGVRAGANLWRGAHLQVDGSQLKIRGQVNGNVLVPKPDERTPLTTDPETRAIVEKYLNAYPKELPNRTDINPRALNTNSPQSIDTSNAGARLDQTWGTKDRATALYGFSSQDVDAFQLVTGQNPDTRIKNHRARLTWSRAWDASTVSDLTAGFDRLGSLLVPEPNAVGPMVSTGGLETLGPQAIIPIDRAVNLYRYAGALKRARGRNAWNAGFEIVRRQLNGTETDAHRGYFSFGNDFGRDSITNLRMGVPSQHIRSIGNVHRGFRNWELQFYGGGNWRARPGLTIDYSLRWQPVTRPYEVNTLNTIPYDADLNNFAPALGLAQRLPSKWGVLRAAGGVQFGEIFPVTYQQVRFSPPGSVKIVVMAPSLVDPIVSAPEKARGNLYVLDGELATPYSYQYNFSWEPAFSTQWRLQLGYVGSRSHKLLIMWYQNRAHPVPGIPQTTATINERRPDQRIGDYRYVLNGSRGYFDAARVSLIVPRWKGLTMDVAYWFSKALDLGTGYTNTAYDADSRQSRCAYEYETRADMRGLSNFDQPHAFLWRATYSLPAGRRPWNGWNFSAVYLAKKGTPFTIVSGSDAPGYGNVDGNGNDRPILLNPSILGRTIGKPDASRTLLPRAAFAYIQPTDKRGNLGRNTFRKGGIRNVNAALWRTWAWNGSRRLMLRAESINLSNTPQFADPGLELANPNFASITNTLNDGRTFRAQLQFAW